MKNFGKKSESEASSTQKKLKALEKLALYGGGYAKISPKDAEAVDWYMREGGQGRQVKWSYARSEVGFRRRSNHQ